MNEPQYLELSAQMMQQEADRAYLEGNHEEAERLWAEAEKWGTLLDEFK